MALQRHLRVVIDAEVYHLPGGKEGETEARRLVKIGLSSGAQFVDLYCAPAGSSQWELIRHFEPVKPPAYFRAAAKAVKKTGTADTLYLPTQEHAELLLDSVFMYPRGTRAIRQLTADLLPNEERHIDVRDIFALTVRQNNENHRISFRLTPCLERIDAITEVFLLAGSKKPDTMASTPHYVRAGRRRERSLSR